ncbi:MULTISPECIES: sensor histidine kinase [Acidithiobacillus]|jgi:two-component system osmolarity sensor histidine kinase EnvZ|uniref:histidine kinase n=3 Tax=Acidithiobacillus caldus TaxID=33059 RepID=F9ZLR4_ACICS|nr:MULTISPECIES: ATP-binding protein [Acidithiobacillus]AEK57599.1 sensor histidine kinase [Acidithiobacillus caldus SM-1]AIA54809.1 periplasmic sensor signal transduction histidine kinase [Acidithiobacillus caldus ATCC 51756]AUW32297.1 HAMP domain-containing protein [Acidithiobacillus caldus]MBU2730391.1 HAMP domain-containing protein [Acidithiobacillus caldus]MBU2735661.1 HAMP domain-containing protein [Acidithiobacillus caldus ATCC 51756]
MRWLRGRSLFAQTAWTLGLGIVVLQTFSLLAVVFTVLYPLAQRSAEDLAGLLIISAQTYERLPLPERGNFARSLRQDNGIVIGLPPRELSLGEAHGHLYGRLLSRILSLRLQQRIPVYTVDRPVPTLWVRIPGKQGAVWLHFDRRRLASSLPLATIVILLLSTLALLILSIILVRRVIRPLAVLADALRRSWKAPLPELPPGGPREFADLLEIFANMRTRLKAMIDHQSLLLVGVSHDLRSPLARLRMAWELLPASTPSKLRDGMLQDMERMGELLSQSLSLGRGLTARVADLDLIALLHEVRADFERAGGRWQEDLPRRYPFRGDYDALRRLLNNILDNARRYGGGQVRVRLLRGGGRGLLRICDSGPGVPEADLEKLFEPFYRGDDARGHEEGSGLGLAIARQLAEAQDMTLRLYNASPTGGLCVELAWPVG